MAYLYIGLTIFYIISLFVYAIITKNKRFIRKQFPEYSGPEWINNIKDPLYNNTYVVEDGQKYRSIINIALYFLCFEVLATFVSLLIIKLWLNANNFIYDQIDATSQLYNEDIYNQMYVEVNPILQIVVYLMAFIPIVIIAKNEVLNDVKGFNTKFIIYAIVGLGFLYVVNIITSAIFTALGITSEATNEEAINAMITSGGISTILISICTVILAPIIEELVFRKAIFNLFPNDNKLALVVSSLLFGAIHVISPCVTAIENNSIDQFGTEFIYLIQYSLMGVVIGLTYIRSNRNITCSIILHFINNTISLIATFLLL